MVNRNAAPRRAGCDRRRITARPVSIRQHQNSPALVRRNQRQRAVQRVCEARVLAVHFAGKFIKPIRARRAFDARFATETHYRQAVAFAHFTVQLFDGLELIRPGARGHRRAAIGHHHQNPMAIRQSHRRLCHRQHQQAERDGAYNVQPAPGQRPRHQRRAQRHEQQQPNWSHQRHLSRLSSPPLACNHPQMRQRTGEGQQN